MSAVLQAIRGNPHALSYVTVSLLTLTPILYYAYSYSPSQLDLETKVVRAPACVCARRLFARPLRAFPPSHPPLALPLVRLLCPLWAHCR